jgi:hypothetical protein
MRKPSKGRRAVSWEYGMWDVDASQDSGRWWENTSLQWEFINAIRGVLRLDPLAHAVGGYQKKREGT